MTYLKRFSNILNYLKGASRTQDGKVIVKNFGYLSLLQIANYVFPLITVPYVSRVIGVEGYGKIAFGLAVVVWFQAVADWGFNYSAMREVAQNRDNEKKVSEVFSNVLWARILLMLVSYSALSLFVIFVPEFRNAADVIFATSLMLIGNVAYPSWFFQAIEKMKFTTIINVSTRLLFTISVFIFIKTPNDYIFQPLLTSLGYIISGMVAMYIIVIRWKVKIVWVSFAAIWKTIKDSFSIFINSFAPNLYNSLTTIVLGFVGGTTSTGLLDSGKKFANMLYPVFSAFSLSFFPYLNRRSDNHSKYAKICLLFASAVSLILFLSAPLIVKLLFGNAFVKCVPIVRLSALSLFALVLNNVYVTNYLLIRGKDRLVRNLTLILSLFGATISYPLILWLDYIGAMIAYTTTTLLIGIVPTYYALKLKRSFRKNT